MKIINFTSIFRIGVLVAVLGIIQSCGSGNLGNKDTMQRDGDGDPTRTGNEGLLSAMRSTQNDSLDNKPASSEDGVRVEVTNFGSEEWAQLKQTYQLEERDPDDNALLQQDREELALGTWAESENNRYQVVYSYLDDGNLWLRLRAKDNNSNLGSGQQDKYLTKEEAENMRLSSAWVEMVRTARRLENDFNNDRSQQNTQRSAEPIRN